MADFYKLGIYGIKRVWAAPWDRFVARRLEVVAVAGLPFEFLEMLFKCGGSLMLFLVFV